MYRHLPSPSALRTFEAAARLRSFKAAADELCVTPTAVSHQVKALETALGLPLFVRRTRAVDLTPAGRDLARAVTEGFARIAATVDDLAAAETRLTVATTPAFAALWLVPRLARFHDRHPDGRVRIEAGTAPVDLHRDRQIDLAIRYAAADTPGLHRIDLPAETVGAFAAPAYLAGLGDVRAATLLETTWQRPGLPAVSWAHWFAAAGLGDGPPPERVRRFDQEHHVVQCGIAGQGLILASTVLVSDLVERGLLAPYRPAVMLPGLRYAVLSTPERARSRKLRAFIDWLRAEAGA